MIEIKNLNFKYKNSEGGTLDNINLTIPDGQVVLLCGKSGCGKTTITRLLNGLIPHYYEGSIGGTVFINDMNIRKTELHEISKVVGSVFQNPKSQFFCVDTSGEMVFGCENEGFLRDEIVNRYLNTVRNFQIENLMGKNLFVLSGGEKQKIACASACVTSPEIIVLDEPTSNLDITAIKELTRIIQMWKEQGKTIVIAEHRLYWLKDVCDRAVYLQQGKISLDVSMEQFKKLDSDRLCGLGLRTLNIEKVDYTVHNNRQTSNLLVMKNFQYKYKHGKKLALDIDELRLPEKAVVAVIGHNGAGKSTLSQCLCGLNRHFKGKIMLYGKQYDAKKMLQNGYMVMQDVNHQLFSESVLDDITINCKNVAKEYVEYVMKKLDLLEYKFRHPMSLSGGQKQRVAIAAAILRRKEILIFDEPTSGLDYDHMQETAELLRSFIGEKSVFVVTHDVELIMKSCTDVIWIEQGKVKDCYPLDELGVSKLKTFFMQ